MCSCTLVAIQTFAGEHGTGSCFQQRTSRPSYPWTCLNPRQFVKRCPFVPVKLSDLYIKTKCCCKAKTYCLGTLQKAWKAGDVSEQSPSCTAWHPQLPLALRPCGRRMFMVVAAHPSSAQSCYKATGDPPASIGIKRLLL